MTDDEKRGLKDSVIIDAAQAEEDLAALTVKAERVGDALIQIGNIFKSDPTQLLNAGLRERIAPLLTKPIASSSPFTDALLLESLILLAKDYGAATTRLEVLNKQKRQLRIA